MNSHSVYTFLPGTHCIGHRCKTGSDSNRGTDSSSRGLRPCRPDHIPSSFPPEDGSNPSLHPFLRSIWESCLSPVQKRPCSALIRPSCHKFIIRRHMISSKDIRVFSVPHFRPVCKNRFSCYACYTPLGFQLFLGGRIASESRLQHDFHALGIMKGIRFPNYDSGSSLFHGIGA